jgi:hypothetical protein
MMPRLSGRDRATIGDSFMIDTKRRSRLMKRRLTFIVAAVLILTMLITPASGPVIAGQSSDMDFARQSGEGFIAGTGARLFPEWANAKLSDGAPYTDLKGNVIAYLFAVTLEGRVGGRMVVGSSLYDYGILQGGQGPYPLLPPADEVKMQLGTEASPEPDLMYLGYDRFYAKYEKGERNICFDLMTGQNVEYGGLASSIASPEEYKQTLAAPGGGFQQTVTLFANPLGVPLHGQYNGGDWPRDCGPTSGAMISEYYQTWHTQFWNWPADHHDMYDKMQCNQWFPLYIGTAPWNFGPGFVSYAAARGAYGWTTDWCVDGSFARVQTEIDNGRPLGLMFSFSSPAGSWHWCAIRGYSGTDQVLINNPGNGGYYDTISWAANKTTSVVTRIFGYTW